MNDNELKNWLSDAGFNVSNSLLANIGNTIAKAAAYA